MVDSLEAKYRAAVNSSNKETELLRMIRNGVSGKVAVIVPKAYYVDIFSAFFMLWFPNRNITCVTANRFNEYEVYDSIISVGNITGKNFDALQCNSAKDVYVLLYDCERQMFRHSQKKAMSFESKINEKMGIEANISEPDRIEENKDDIKIIQEFSELDRFIDELSSFDINRFVSTGANTFGSSAISAEVKFIGTFITGEQILFSKYYSAVVFNRSEKKVEELSADRLSQGDVVVFTKRNDYTRNIVDIIFEQLKRNNRLDKKITEAIFTPSFIYEGHTYFGCITPIFSTNFSFQVQASMVATGNAVVLIPVSLFIRTPAGPSAVIGVGILYFESPPIPSVFATPVFFFPKRSPIISSSVSCSKNSSKVIMPSATS